MKNISKKLISIVFILLVLSPVSFAQETPPPETPTPSSSSNPVSVTDLFKPATGNDSRVKAVKDLPGAKAGRTQSLPEVIGAVIKILLNISGALALLGFTIAGALMIIGTQGKEEYLKKGKDLMKASIAGLVVIAISYALVIGVSSLEFFTPGASVSGGSQTNTSSSSSTTSTTSTPDSSSTDRGTASAGN